VLAPAGVAQGSDEFCELDALALGSLGRVGSGTLKGSAGELVCHVTGGGRTYGLAISVFWGVNGVGTARGTCTGAIYSDVSVACAPAFTTSATTSPPASPATHHLLKMLFIRRLTYTLAREISTVRTIT
jgi:hypothetical protein